ARVDDDVRRLPGGLEVIRAEAVLRERERGLRLCKLGCGRASVEEEVADRLPELRRARGQRQRQQARFLTGACGREAEVEVVRDDEDLGAPADQLPGHLAGGHRVTLRVALDRLQLAALDAAARVDLVNRDLRPTSAGHVGERRAAAVRL